MDAITDRILAQLGDRELINKLSALPKSDFNSLLIKIFQNQAKNTKPTDVMKAFQTNRFSVPSELNPAAYHILEAELLSLAEEADIKPILLSPSAPFASCAAFGCVDQNNIVSAVRGTEILSDPTNMLSIIAAEQFKEKSCNKNPLHYCTTARVLRAQPFPPTKGYYSHFGLFCIVSAGEDSGSYICEKELMLKQLSYYRQLFNEKYRLKLTVTLRKRRGYTDGDGFFDSISNLVKKGLPDVPISFDFEQEDNNYYKGINFKIYMEKESGRFEIGDGGYVDWMQKMTGCKKVRCLISGISLDRLLLPL